MLTPYRRVLSEPGTLLFSLTGFVARLPISMIGLGIVLLVEDATGSYGLAGSVSATFIVANACLAIVHGRLVDALGQARVLPVVETVFGVALALMTWSVQADWPRAVTYGLAAVAGAAIPQIGACVRSRWSHALSDSHDVQTAYALESVIDEAIFICGPILVTALATAWHPVAGLAAALICGLSGTYALAAQRSTAPPAHARHGDGSDRPRMPWELVAPLTAVCVALGVIFGAAEVATVGFAEEAGAKSLTGVLLAFWALGSLVAGVVTGAVRWRVGPDVRARRGIFLLSLAMVPPVFIDSPWLMAPVLFVGGLAIAPTLIACLSLVERQVPSARLNESMAVLHTGMAFGLAPGAAVAGYVIDHYGASAAYVVPVAAGLIGSVAALLLRVPAQPAAPDSPSRLTPPEAVRRSKT